VAGVSAAGFEGVFLRGEGERGEGREMVT